MKTNFKLTIAGITLTLAFLFNIGYAQQLNYYGQADKTPQFETGKSGDLLFDQRFNPGTGFMASHHFTTVTNNTETCAVADDFDVPEGETWEIGSIRVLGTYWEGQPGGGDTLNVYILNDNDGVPGDTAYGYFAHTNFLQEEENVNGYVNTQFEILLPDGVTLTEGKYWVSVQMFSDLNTTGQWGWFDHLPSPALYGNDWHWINPKDGWGYGYTTWTPATIVVGPWLQHDVSFALFGPAYNNDISILEISSPDDFFYGPPTEEQEVTVTIKNEGLDPQTGFDIIYNLNGVEVLENIGSVTLTTNESYEFTFSQTIDLSMPGNYDLSVSTLLTGDENPGNDSKNLNIIVFDPTVYLMPSLAADSDTTCSGTFSDSEGLDADLVNQYDWGIYTIYPATPGAKIRLEFIQFDIGWGDFWIYDGENVNATELGWWEDTISPGTLQASYGNTSGALTIQYTGQGWTPFEGHSGWAAGISCHILPEDDFAVIDVNVSHPVITEYDHVTVYAHIKNLGTTILDKDITFSANGIDFATTPSGMVAQSDTVIVEATWVPTIEGDYSVTATLPDDQGTDNNNSLSTMQHVYDYTFFKEGFDLPTFPPDGWSQTSILWTRSEYWLLEGAGGAYFEGVGTLVDTLITPRLVIEAGDMIEFSAFSSNWWPGELDLVWIDAETGESELIDNVSLPTGWYATFEVDVTAAAGNNYLGFVGKGMASGGYGRVELDEVEGIGIEKFFYNDDLKTYRLFGDNTPIVDIPSSFNVDVKNVGLDVISGSEYSIKLMQEPGVELMSYPGTDINPKERNEFTLDYTFTTSGEKHIYAVVDFADDEDLSNNTAVSLVIFVQQDGTIQIPIGEGGGENFFYPYSPSPGGGSYSQTLFLAEDVGDPMTITGIMYYYSSNENYPIYDFPIQIWFDETTLTNVADSAFIPVTNMYKTFDGVIDFYPGENGVYIPLDFPYPYTGQNLMVTGFKEFPSPNVGGSWSWKTTSTTEVMTRYISDLNDWLDPYDSLNINSFYRHYVNEFGNVKFFKIDLTGQYCLPQTVFGTMNGDYVDGVTFNELENTGTGGIGGPAYNNYSAFTTPVERDRYYELTVQAETSGSEGSIAAWIDFNGDKDFDDEGERVLHMSNPGLSQEVSTLVKIPADAELGITLMRVRNSSTPDLFPSCGAVDYGETEDYTINILETEQSHYPVPDFMVDLLEEGNVELSWSLPENPGQSMVEGFELSEWPPAGWEVKTSLTLDGTLEDPTDNTWMQYGDSLVYNGAYSAMCADSAPDFNWLITPPVQMYSNDDLSFMLNYSSDVDGYSKFYVLVEMDGEWTTIYELTDEIVYYNNYDEAVTVELSAFAGKTIRVAFVTEYNDAYPISIDDVILKGIESSSKGVDGIVGYNIYRNGELITEITDPSVLSSTDIVTVTENYIYCIKVVYESDESEAVCDEVFYLVPLTPPLNVRATADNNDVTVKWIAPNQGMMRFSDDFENYAVNQQVACQNPDNWTTWTQNPCSENDPFITDEIVYSGVQSVVNEGASDLLYKTDEILTEGKYSINFKLYIAENYNGYFNVLQEHDLGTGAHWGFQAFFDQGGEGSIDAGGFGTAIFDFGYDEWIHIEVIVDLDSDWAEFSVNDELIYEWEWHLGISGGGLSEYNTLRGVDWYSWSSNAPAKFFLDDFQLIQLYSNTNDLSYNVYRNDEFISNVSNAEFYDDDMEAGVYNYCVSALYDEGESDTDCDNISIITAPENFTASAQNETEVFCEWDEIVSANLLGYQVYRDGELLTGLLTEPIWTDEILEGGTYTYYATAVYDGQESLPSNSGTVVILLVPQNLTANANTEGEIVLNWDPLGEVVVGDLIELTQHDGVPVNAFYEYFNNGYGVVYDLSAYPDATIEMVDFHHGSWGNSGTWFYKMHIVDWNTFTSIAEFGPFTTTGDDIYEIGIPLGSVAPNSDLVAILMEPMSFDPANAYPILSCDEELQGLSVRAYIPDLSAFLVETADFLMDLWIFNSDDKKMVQAKKFKVDNSNNPDARMPYTPVIGEVTLEQKETVDGSKEKNLQGYNIHYAHESNPFEFLDIAYDTTYSHEEAGLILGMHNYYVTAIYSEGESDPSETASEYISGITNSEMENMQIYPNPILDVVNIETDQDIMSVIVINSKGQVVFEEDGINKNNYQINIADQATGLYNIRIETEEGWMSRKMIKK